MNQVQQVIEQMQHEFPSLTDYDFANPDELCHLFKLTQGLADYTKEQLCEGNDLELEHCFRVAYDILHCNCRVVQNAMENVYIYSVSHVLERKEEVMMWRNLFMKYFGKEYHTQVCAYLP